GRPGLWVALVGVALSVLAIAFVDRLGIVSSLCMVLLFLIGFGGAGARLQLDRARRAHPKEAVDGVAAALRVLIVFALVTPFWSLFDRKAGPWVLQANDMARPHWLQPD